MCIGTKDKLLTSTMFLKCMMLCIIYSVYAQKSRQTECKYRMNGLFAYHYYCEIMKACCLIDSKWKCIETIGEYDMYDAWYISHRCKFHERSTSNNKTMTARAKKKTDTTPAYIKTTHNRRQRQRTRNRSRMNIRRNFHKTIGINTQSRGFSRYIRSTTGYRHTEYTPSPEENLFRILPAAIVVAMIIFFCVCCCVYDDMKQHKMRLKNRIRIQQSRALQLTNEQQHYRVIGLYYDNGNAAACVAYPRMQLEYGADLEMLINSTPDCTASLSTDNPPAYEDMINGNTTAIDTYNPRTHAGDVEERNTHHIPNNSTITDLLDDTKYLPTVSPPAYEDIMKGNAAEIVSYNPRTRTQDKEERLANYIAKKRY
ncbi:uncharacterized protein LOC127714399 [Mytilus californianus]|uniref:uncharacterized protein LOC127714399 n=1 Tax=Mytilus californianus TaxID=6549 RepID=UPI002246C761|nr:uncharacterized protein LOC127714399 [Mytilus californianus]